MQKPLALIFSIGAALAPMPSLAQVQPFNYTFSVPVTTTNNIAGTKLSITCSVFDGGLASLVGTPTGTGIAANSISDIPLEPVGGTFTKTFTVAVPSAKKAIAYRCNMAISDGREAFITDKTPGSGYTGTFSTSGRIP